MKVFQFRRGIITLTIASLTTSALPSLLQAQEAPASLFGINLSEYRQGSNTDNLPEPTKEQIKQGMPFVSQLYRKFYSIKDSSKEAEFIDKLFLNNGEGVEPPIAPGDKQPIAHYRFKEGSDFPSPQQIVAQQEKGEIQLAALQKSVIDAAEAEREETLNNPPEPEPPAPPVKLVTLPTCEESISADLDIPEDYLAQGIPADVLFFNGKPPFDVATTIGKSTTVIAFGDPSTADVVSPYTTLEIPCVPFRVRSNGNKVTYSKGGLALKNYDANSEGDGTFDPTIRKYIQQNNLGLENNKAR